MAAHRLLLSISCHCPAESWRWAQRLQLPQTEKLLWNPWGGKWLKIHEGSILGKRTSSSEGHGPRVPESPAQCARPLPSTLMSKHHRWTLTTLHATQARLPGDTAATPCESWNPNPCHSWAQVLANTKAEPCPTHPPSVRAQSRAGRSGGLGPDPLSRTVKRPNLPANKNPTLGWVGSSHACVRVCFFLNPNCLSRRGGGRSWLPLGEGRAARSWHGNGSPSSTHPRRSASVNFEHLPERS